MIIQRLDAEFRGEIYYTEYVIIIGDYIVSQFVGVTVEDICYILFFLPYSKLQSAVRKIIISTT